jgi:hypothetical protein
MGHAGARAMGKYKTGARLRRANQKCGDRGRMTDRDLELLAANGVHLI